MILRGLEKLECVEAETGLGVGGETDPQQGAAEEWKKDHGS